MTPDDPATPDPPQPKRLGSEAWIQMIVLGLVFSLIAFIVVFFLTLSYDLGVVIAFAIGTLQLVASWAGTGR
jgi:hypothetical protein